jgi:hypothetical protein
MWHGEKKRVRKHVKRTTEERERGREMNDLGGNSVSELQKIYIHVPVKSSPSSGQSSLGA